jgi:Cytochrome P460
MKTASVFGSALFTVATLGVIVAFTALASEKVDQQIAPFVKEIPPGYRDWRLVSVAHEEGDLHSIGVVLGNDVAINAYREGKLPFPDGTIIAALHYRHVPSEENNKVFGRAQSFVPGAPTNIQFTCLVDYFAQRAELKQTASRALA